MNTKISLSAIVRKNLRRIRKDLKLTQDDLAKAFPKLGRSGYNRKETGEAPITLDELDAILNNFDHILLEDILAGIPLFSIQRNVVGLSEEAQHKFPYLSQIIMLANGIAGTDDDQPEDLKFLSQSLEYALKKLPVPETCGLAEKAKGK